MFRYNLCQNVIIPPRKLINYVCKERLFEITKTRLRLCSKIVYELFQVLDRFAAPAYIENFRNC